MSDLSSEPQSMRDAFAATLDWWREAGVEDHVTDEPGTWLKSRDAEPEHFADVAERSPPPPPPEPPRKAALSRFIESGEQAAHPGDPTDWPAELDEFQKWWMESDAVDAPGSYPRRAQRGSTEPEAMLVIDQPGAEDSDVLLQGASGTLARNMLRAMGIAEHSAYFASVLPRHTLRPEWEAIGRAGYGKLLLHHIGLVRPRRVFVCGERVWSLLSHETTQAPDSLTILSINSDTVPLFAMPDMPTLLRNPARRAQTWNRWLDWSARF